MPRPSEPGGAEPAAAGEPRAPRVPADGRAASGALIVRPAAPLVATPPATGARAPAPAPARAAPPLVLGAPRAPGRSRAVVALGAIGWCALVAFAHAPLLGAGLFGADYAELLSPGARAPWSVARVLLEPPAPGGSALALRLEALLLLVVAALALRACLARLLEPWLGAHTARAAALAAAILLPLHPAAPGATAELAGRGELVALSLALVAGALFLRGRQEQREVATAAGVALLAPAAWASPVAALFAPAFALADLFCVRRHRRRSLRLRTAATTALLAGAATALSIALRSGGAPAPAAGGATSLGAASLGPVSLGPGAELRERALALASELGRVATAPESLGVAGTLVAVALLLLALQPALRATRSAPRLWGRVVVVLGATLLVALARASSEGADSRRLLALCAWCAALGLSLTSLARPWRAGAVAVVALGWAVLAHAGARPFAAGSDALARLRAEIVALAPPSDARVLVVDPPAVAGLPSLARDLGWLFHPRLHGEVEDERFSPERVRALTAPALLALASTDVFRAWRSQRVVALVPARALGRAAGPRLALELPPPRAAPREAPAWRAELTFDPPEPLDPLALERARLVADLAVPAEELESLGWRSPSGESGSCRALVRELGGRRVAEFDLASSLAWLLAGSVRGLVVERGTKRIESGELSARAGEVPGLGEPLADGADWTFARPALAEAPPAGARLVLGLLDLGTLEHVELVLAPDPADAARRVRAFGAARFAARASGAPVAWTVEYRIGAHALLRSRGAVP